MMPHDIPEALIMLGTAAYVIWAIYTFKHRHRA